LRAKRSNLVVKIIKHFEIAASHKSLLAMTNQDFFSKLLEVPGFAKDHHNSSVDTTAKVQ